MDELSVTSAVAARAVVWRPASLAALVLAECVPGARALRLASADGAPVPEVWEIPLQADGALPERGASPLGDAAFLRELDDEAFGFVRARARSVTLAEGETLFRQGDPSETLFVVAEGTLVPMLETVPRKRLAPLGAGQAFGELGLVCDEPHAASVEAATEARLLAIDRALAHALVGEHPGALAGVLRSLRDALTGPLLRTSPLFACLGPDDRRALAARFRFLEAPAGATLFAEGAPADALFVVLCGALDVRPAHGGAERDHLRLGAADVLGESLLATDEPAPASVVARSKCWLVALHRGELRALVARRTHLGALVAELAEERRDREGAAGAPARVFDRRLGLF
ncbi:MAG TPA: cyclic nucleotide-binding domain-containing protein [Myxococcota bacterium]|nr:cyclic nucleotide-binding domain-containing protein [Myxococcota bacterium]